MRFQALRVVPSFWSLNEPFLTHWKKILRSAPVCGALGLCELVRNPNLQLHVLPRSSSTCINAHAAMRALAFWLGRHNSSVTCVIDHSTTFNLSLLKEVCHRNPFQVPTYRHLFFLYLAQRFWTTYDITWVCIIFPELRGSLNIRIGLGTLFLYI